MAEEQGLGVFHDVSPQNACTPTGMVPCLCHLTICSSVALRPWMCSSQPPELNLASVSLVIPRLHLKLSAWPSPALTQHRPRSFIAADICDLSRVLSLFCLSPPQSLFTLCLRFSLLLCPRLLATFSIVPCCANLRNDLTPVSLLSICLLLAVL